MPEHATAVGPATQREPAVKEVHVVERLYQVAQPGALLLAMTSDVPWRFRDYERYQYVAVASTPEWKRIGATATNVSVSAVTSLITRRLKDKKHQHAYLIVTRSQIANADLFGIFPHGLVERLERGLTTSRAFRVVFANRDGRIFELARPAE